MPHLKNKENYKKNIPTVVESSGEREKDWNRYSQSRYQEEWKKREKQSVN
jgi:hypothetical protein